VNSGHSLFFRASASCSKILNVKSIFNTVTNFRANSVLQGKRRVAQKSWMVRNIFNAVKIFRGNCFSDKFFNTVYSVFFHTVYSVYIHFGVIRVIWASVVCNLDQSRDWLKWLWYGPSSRFYARFLLLFLRTLLLSATALILTSNFSQLAEVGKFWSSFCECSV